MLAYSVKLPPPLAWSRHVTGILSPVLEVHPSQFKAVLEPEALASPLVTAQEEELYCIGITNVA